MVATTSLNRVPHAEQTSLSGSLRAAVVFLYKCKLFLEDNFGLFLYCKAPE